MSKYISFTAPNGARIRIRSGIMLESGAVMSHGEATKVARQAATTLGRSVMNSGADVSIRTVPVNNGWSVQMEAVEA